MNAPQDLLLQLILKVAGYRRSSPQRRSSRSRRWSRSAQTLFASWAVLGQLGGMGLLLGELVTVPLNAEAQTSQIPNSWGGPSSADTSNAFNSWGSMALGAYASSGYSTTDGSGSSIAIGSFTNASQSGSVAIGIGAASNRANQIILGASTNVNETIKQGADSRTFSAVKNETTVTIPNLSGTGNAIIIAKSDGTLSRRDTSSGGGLDDLNCTRSGKNAVCHGVGANATGQNTTSIGAWANATATNATALGASANANANGSAALGAHAKAWAKDTTAVGTFAKGLPAHSPHSDPTLALHFY